MIDIIKAEFSRRMIDEGLQRIGKCLSLLSEDEIWFQKNANTNSIGNLVLHLNGNVKQYIVATLGNQKDDRTRPEEFKISSRINSEEAFNQLSQTVNQANNIIKEISFDDLTRKNRVQGFEESTLSIIIHVIEHFSYHVGQVTFYTKFIKDIDTGYYAGLDLTITD